MKSIQSIFPKASKSFLEANTTTVTVPIGTIVNVTMENAITDILKRSGRGSMNKTEAEYGMILEAMKRKGEILRYEYEGITLRWADMRYTPDFIVFDTTSSAWLSKDYPEIKIIRGIRLIEVKGGHIWDHAIVRFKGARAYWPEFQFEMHQKKKGEWRRLH